jgi:hypothetical protein
MVFIELKKTGEASRRFESLRKFVERTLKKEEIRSRDLLIVKLLREMEKDEFELDRNNAVALSLLEKLDERNKDHSWEHFTPELVPFHKWAGQRFRS